MRHAVPAGIRRRGVVSDGPRHFLRWHSRPDDPRTLEPLSGLSKPAMNLQPRTRVETSDRKVIRLQIRGKVQGVYYRASMVDAARQLEVTGWVRNRNDGSVEAMACGTHAQLDQLTEWARRGPPAAMVVEVLISPGKGEFADFAQWPTA